MTTEADVGWVRPKAVTHQGEAAGYATLTHPTEWVAIEQVAEINPRIDKSAIPDDLAVSFVPMPAVGEENGHICVDATRLAGEVKKGYTAFLEGDVLFAKITPCMENGKMAVAPKLVNGYGFGSTEFHVLRPKAWIDAKYLYFYVSSKKFRSEAERHMTGAVGQRRVPTAYLKECLIPVVPLDHQKRIVAEIEKQFSRLDEAIANLKRVKANLKRYKAAVLKAAVEGRLVETEAERARRAAQGSANVAGGRMPGATEGRSLETGEQLLQRILETRRSQWSGRGKYKEPAAPDTTNLPELPEGWVWASAEQISDFITKGTTPVATKLSDGSGEIQFLKVYNLTFEGLLNDTYKPAFVSRDTHEGELSRSKVRAGDVLINIVGPPLGQVSVVPPKIVEANINQAIARFRPIPPLGSDYLSVAFLSESVMTWATRKAKTTAGQSNLTLELCRAIPIPLPPEAEQHRIVAEVDRRLTLLREAEAQVDANLQRAEHLRQSILSRAFSGDLPPAQTLSEVAA
ncbi:MAG: restriction endonuclease subunit S [Pseudomonadota bacterium]